MRRILTIILLIVLLLGGLTACSGGAEEETSKTPPSGDAEATKPEDPPAFSSDFESGDTSEWSETGSGEDAEDDPSED